MLKKITGSILTIMLMTTMFLGAFSVAAPQPVHAAAYTYTIIISCTNGGAEFQSATIDGTTYNASWGVLSKSLQVDALPSTISIKVNNKTNTLDQQYYNTNGVKKNVTVGNQPFEVTSSLTSNHTHTWNNNSYKASGNKITATCQGQGTCPLAQPTLTLNASGKTYDGSIVTATLTKSSTWTQQSLPTPTITYSPANPKNVGTYTASVKVGNATATKQFTISPKTLTLSWGNNTFTYDGNSHAPTASISGVVSGDTCNVSVSGEKTNVGSYTATASIDNNNYALPSSNTKEFTISPKPLTITGLTAKNRVYDGTATADLDVTQAKLEGVVDADEGKVEIDQISGVYTGENAKNVGTDKPIKVTVTLKGDAAGNYEVAEVTGLTSNVTQRPITVSGIKSRNKKYDGTTIAPSGSFDCDEAVLDGKVGNDKLGVEAEGTFPKPDAGDYTITITNLTLTGDDKDNYKLAEEGQQEECSGRITQYEVTVTADDKTREYGASDPAFTYKSNPETLIGDDKLEGELSREQGGDVGEYKIIQHTLHDHENNYAIHYVPGTLTITKATENNVTASIEGWTYGGEPNEPTATGKHGADTATFTYSDSRDGDYTADVPTAAGTWYVKATVAETNNYVGAVSEPKEFTIAKKEVGLEWTDTEFTYDGAAHKPTATATGLVGEDKCEVTVEGEQTDANAKTDTESYEAEAIALDNPNYKLPEDVKKNFTIAPKELKQSMISLDSDTIKHDGTKKGPEVTMIDKDITEGKQPKQMAKDEDYTLSGDVSSSELGTHVITAEGTGNYTGSIETSWMMYSKKSNDQKEEGTGGRGGFEVFGDIESNTSDITVSNFTIDLAKGFLTEEDMARYMEGEDVLIYMIIKEQPKSETGAGDRYILDQLFRETGATDISWYDITVWKKIGNSPATRVHDTGKEILMSVEVPDGQKNAPEGYTREFYMGRSHDGASKLLAQTSEVKVGFGSSKFSTYALAYKDTEKPKDDPGNGGKKGKGGANTGDPNDIAGLIALMLASGGALGAIGCRRRRSRSGR